MTLTTPTPADGAEPSLEPTHTTPSDLMVDGIALSSRERILRTLTKHGTISDVSGRATARLADLCHYQGSSSGISQLLTAMERDGLIVRRIAGKRVFEIRLEQRAILPAPQEVTPDPTPDAAAVAFALLERVVELAGKPDRDAQALKASQQRLSEVLEENDRLRKAHRLAQDQAVAYKTEADGLRMRLAEVRKQLDAIASGHRVDERRLKELGELVKLMKAPTTGK